MLKSTWFNVLMLIIFPPIGILTMFLFARWNVLLKIVIAIVMSAYTIELLNFLIDFFNNIG